MIVQRMARPQLFMRKPWTISMIPARIIMAPTHHTVTTVAATTLSKAMNPATRRPTPSATHQPHFGFKAARADPRSGDPDVLVMRGPLVCEWQVADMSGDPDAALRI